MVTPGHGEATLASTYHGVLPPPSPIVLHLELRSRGGAAVGQRECELALVNARGKPAWAGDLVRRDAQSLTWHVTRCH